jgi:hypothetical protein
MKRTISIALATCVLLTACGDPLSPPPESVAGTYTLTSEGGEPLPQGVRGRLELGFNAYGSGRFLLRLQNIEQRGFFSLGPSTIHLTFHPSDYPMNYMPPREWGVGALAGNRLTISYSHRVLVFEK